VPYFLDGNNLIGLVRKTARPSPADRQALVGEIADRLRRTRARATIFFDGGPGERPASLGPLSVRAAGGSADDAIVRAVEHAPTPAEAIVVTADRELSARVRSAGGKVVAPERFFERFGAGEAPVAGPGAVDVEEWLRYFADESNRDA